MNPGPAVRYDPFGLATPPVGFPWLGRAGLDLETVVPVRMPASGSGCSRRDQIGRDEQRPPSLVLTNVCQLVGKQHIVDVIDTKHDVTERDRPVAPTETARPFRPFAEQDPVPATATLEEWTEQEPDEAPRPRPQITKPVQSGTSETTSTLNSVISSIA